MSTERKSAGGSPEEKVLKFSSYHSDYSSANLKSFACTKIRNKLRKWDYAEYSSAKT
jgi:hypothetical protein